MTTNRLARDLDEMLNRSREAFEPLRGERIFITGGTGFVGTWLTEAFAWANRRLALGASAHLLSRDPQRFLQRAPHLGTDDAIVLLAGDATAFDPPPGTFRYVIHAATQMTSAAIAQRPVDTYEADVRATRNALEFARAAGAERLLYTSSGAAYGPQPPDFDALPESYPGAPSTTDAAAVYANAKRASEFLCTTYAHQFGLTVPIARLFAFSGPYLPLDANFAIGNFVGDVLAGRPIAIAGDGTPYRSYLYAADLARWCWTIASAGARRGRVDGERSIVWSRWGREPGERDADRSEGEPAMAPQGLGSGATLSRATRNETLAPPRVDHGVTQCERDRMQCNPGFASGGPGCVGGT